MRAKGTYLGHVEAPPWTADELEESLPIKDANGHIHAQSDTSTEREGIAPTLKGE
jgi:hypothetical protein